MLHLEWLLPHNAKSEYGTKLCFPVDDYFDDEDRLVPVDLDLGKLKIQCLSLVDWVVSKLGSPKLSDALDLSGVTLDVLLQAGNLFPLYGGYK